MDPYYEQRLRDEVIYLHSLWHQGPPRPAAVTVPPQLRPYNPTQFKKNKRQKQKPRAEIGQKSSNSAAETNSSGGAGRPPPPPSTTGGPSAAPKPQSQPNSGVSPQLRPVNSTQFKKKKNRNRNKKLRAEIGQNSTAETNSSAGAEWPCPPSPPPPSTSWPSPAPKPQSQPNPLSIEDQLKLDSRKAHRSALRVVCEFIANNYADDSDGMDSSSDEDDEFMGEDYEYRFFFKVFKDDTELRSFYEKNFARGEFSCLVCAAIGGKKSSKKFKGCLPLVQHTITIAKAKKKRAHRAFGQAICKVLGWDIDNLSQVVSMLDAMGAGSSDIKESSTTLVTNVVSVSNDDVEGKDEETVPESVDIRCGISVNGDEGNAVAAARDGAGSSDNMESSVILVSNIVSVDNDDLEDKNEAVPENVENGCRIAHNGDEGEAVTAARDEAGGSENMESSVPLVSNIVSVNDDDLEDKNEVVPENVKNRCRIAINGDEGDAVSAVRDNPVTCRDAVINSEDNSMVRVDNVEKPTSDVLTSTITCPDAGTNLEDASIVLTDNMEKPPSDGLTSNITCPDAGINSEDAMVLTDNVEKPASDELTSTITCPDAVINVEDGSTVRTDNVENPASDGFTNNSSACPGADKNLENLGSEYHSNVEETSLPGLTINSLTSTDADRNTESHDVEHLLNTEDTASELLQNVPLNNDVGDKVRDLKTG